MEIQDALLNSQAYKSLSIESEIFDIVRKYFPNSSRSPYFLDNITNKLREIDIVAEARFEKKIKNPIFCDINFFIECKTNKGYNIIVDDFNKHKEYDLYDWEVWVGDDVNDRLKKSRAILLKGHLDNDTINSTLKMLSNIFYPNEGKRTWKVGLEVFPNIKSYSSFRETNTKDEKDLDNSVLWRAFQSLSSAHTAFNQNAWEYYEEDLLLYAEGLVNPHVNYAFGLDDLIHTHAIYTDVIQKIIVIDSPLWEKTNENTLNQIKFFRLPRKRIDSIYIDFVDVVNREYFPEYIQELSDFYVEFKKTKKLKRVY